MMDLYRKNVFSTRPWPSFFTNVIVRSRSAHSPTPPEQDQTSGWGQSPAPAHGAPCFALPSLA